MPFLSQRADGAVLLCIYVQPQASKSKIVGVHDERLKLAVAAPPVDGKANGEVVKYLAKLFRLAKRDVSIYSGAQSKRKRVMIQSLDVKEVRAKIEDVLGNG